METKLFQPDQINEVISLLKAGKIVALPTETVYGLAADAKNEDAIKKIFIAKKRPINHPLIVHIDSFNRIQEWVDKIPDCAYQLSESFWPGPLTILLNKKSNVSDLITGSSPKIALRIPNNHLMLDIINKTGGALVAPSANVYKKLSSTKAEHVINNLSGKISAVLDGGKCSVGIESTILDLTTEIPRILRPGSISKDMIESSLNIEVTDFKNHSEQVSRNILDHYQPNIPCFLMTLCQIQDYIGNSGNINIAVMHYSYFLCNKVKSYKLPSNQLGFSQNMYETLHEIDKSGAQLILIEMPPREWIDVNDRLYKAQYKK